MREYEPIHIRPLTLRGVFGITWKVLRRRTGALLGYNALYILVVLLIVGLCALPTLLPLVQHANELPPKMEAFRVLGGSLMTVLLTLLGSLVLMLLVTPITAGTLYGEMSARIYGSASSVGQMLKRSKYSLKRFFTTSLCYALAAFAILFVLNIITSVMVTFGAVFAALGSIPSLAAGSGLEAGLLVPFILIMLLVAVLEVACISFLAFVYPIVVNEPAKNFAAIKRSFQLVWKRFGRVFGCQLIVTGIVLLVFLLLIVGIVLAVFARSMVAIVVLGTLVVLLYLGLLLFIGPYQYALTTVLYFDTRTRLEGTAWLGEPEPQPAQPEEAAQAQPKESAQQEESVQPEEPQRELSAPQPPEQEPPQV